MNTHIHINIHIHIHIFAQDIFKLFTYSVLSVFFEVKFCFIKKIYIDLLRKEGNVYSMTHSTHFSYGYMGYSFQDNTYHSVCYTSRGALVGTRNSSMGPPLRINQTTHRSMSECCYHGATSRSALEKATHTHTILLFYSY